jgi:YbgC/YbaW family acyl-CoA thioester hydrolase
MPTNGHDVFQTSVTARTFDIDAARHVSNITYVRWLEVARNEFMDEIGASIHTVMDEGVAPIVARTDIRYRHPVGLGEQVTITLWLERLRALSATLLFDLRLRGTDTVVASATQLGLFVSLESGKPARLPDSFREKIGPFVDHG